MSITDKEIESNYLFEFFRQHMPNWDTIKEIAKEYGVKNMTDARVERIAGRIADHLTKVNKPIDNYLTKRIQVRDANLAAEY